MEIPKLNVGIEEGKIKKSKLDVDTEHNKSGSELIESPSIKQLDLNFKPGLEEMPSFLLTLQPLDFFNSLEEEYGKVKDFDFRKVDVEEIKKHIRTL